MQSYKRNWQRGSYARVIDGRGKQKKKKRMVEEGEHEEPGTAKKSKKWVTDHFKNLNLEVPTA